MSEEHLRSLLAKAFPEATIDIKDLAGDGDHYAATITSSAFEGKTRIQQHQMVFDALEGHMGKKLHALSVTTQLPRK